jgi:sugar (pentulose or hexulose) kinase
MLANVDALGEPTPTARFMGGREYAAIAGQALKTPPTLAGLDGVLAAGAMALPSFAPAGPFATVKGSVRDAESLTSGGQSALATLYCALMADLMLDRLGVEGAIIVDGPFAANPLFAPILQSLRPAQPVVSGGTRGGVAIAAIWLAGASVAPESSDVASDALIQAPGLRAYRERWRSLLPS